MSSERTSLDLQIEVASTAEEAMLAFEPMCKAFGEQTQDAIFLGMSPGWETPEGKQKAAERLANRFITRTFNRDGKPNVVFLNAMVVDPLTKERVIAGMAIWEQESAVIGYGDLPPEKDSDLGTETIYPGDPVKQKYWASVLTCQHAQRYQLVKAKATEPLPALMALDICAVSPRFQGHGIAKKLVEWGLEEAKARGDLECVTEASVMGRRVYQKLGFEPEGPEIAFNVDASLSERPLPSNLFLRTKKPSID